MSKSLELLNVGAPVRLRRRSNESYQIIRLLWDQFTTDAAAPLISPRTCEPGPGTLTLVQTDGQFSASAGKFNFGAQATPTWGDQGLYTGALARVAGRVLLADIAIIVNSTLCGIRWLTAAGLSDLAREHQFDFGPATGFYPKDGTSFPLIGTAVAGQTYSLAMVLRSSGVFQLAKGGAYTEWTLLWPGLAGNTATLYGAFSNNSAAGTLDNLEAFDLAAPWTDDYGICAVSQAAAVSGTAYTSVADAIHDLTVTAPNPLAESTELRYRVADDSNYWTAYLNNAGAFRLDSVAAGTPTNRINVAAVATAGNTYTLRVVADGTKHNCYTLAGAAWTKRGGEIDVSHQNTQTAIKPIAGTGWTLGALRSYPRRASAYSMLDAT
jgi:hypothetical protein